MNRDVIELDGSSGGGQVLRSALSLSMITGRALHIHHIRGQRSRPGLLRQHLTAVLAAARICEAQVSGAELGSQALWFEPGKVRAGDYEFASAARAVAHWYCKRSCRHCCCRANPVGCRSAAGPITPWRLRWTFCSGRGCHS